MKGTGVRATKVSDGTVRLEGRVTKSFRKQVGDKTADAVQRAIDGKKVLNSTAIKSLFADAKNRKIAEQMEGFTKKQAGTKGQAVGVGGRSIRNPALAGKKEAMVAPDQELEAIYKDALDLGHKSPLGGKKSAMEGEDVGGAPRFKIALLHMGRVQEKFDKIVKRAQKLGITPPKLVDHGEVREEVKDDKGNVTGYNVYRSLSVEGEPPKIGGWQMVAAVHHLTDADANLVMPVGKAGEGVDLKPYHKASAVCDHCKQARDRNKTYVLADEKGQLKQVGRSCLKDFLGHDPEPMLAFAEMLDQMTLEIQSGSIGGKGKDLMDIQEYMAYVAKKMREDGWVGRGQAREQGKEATADLALKNMMLQPKNSEEREKAAPKDEDFKRAEEIVEWLRGLKEEDADNDFMRNLVTVGQMPGFRREHTGVVAAAAIAYQKYLDRKAGMGKSSTNLKPNKTGVVGQNGDQLNRDATVLDVRSYKGGAGLMYQLYDHETGNLLVVFGGPNGLGNNPDTGKPIQSGERIWVEGRGKHGNFAGQDQTILGNAKLGKNPQAGGQAPKSTAVSPAVKYVGQVGDKLKARKGKVLSVREFKGTGHRGNPISKVAITVIDEETGATVTTFTERYRVMEEMGGFEAGDEISYDGSVTDHSSYKGEPQTVIQRAKFSHWTGLSPKVETIAKGVSRAREGYGNAEPVEQFRKNIAEAVKKAQAVEEKVGGQDLERRKKAAEITVVTHALQNEGVLGELKTGSVFRAVNRLAPGRIAEAEGVGRKVGGMYKKAQELSDKASAAAYGSDEAKRLREEANEAYKAAEEHRGQVEKDLSADEKAISRIYETLESLR